MEAPENFEAHTSPESIEGAEAWRELKEQAPAEAESLLADKGINELPIAEKVEALKDLLDELSEAGNDKRFVVEAVAQHLTIANQQLAFNRALAGIHMTQRPEINQAA